MADRLVCGLVQGDIGWWCVRDGGVVRVGVDTDSMAHRLAISKWGDGCFSKQQRARSDMMLICKMSIGVVGFKLMVQSVTAMMHWFDYWRPRRILFSFPAPELA